MWAIYLVGLDRGRFPSCYFSVSPTIPVNRAIKVSVSLLHLSPLVGTIEPTFPSFDLIFFLASIPASSQFFEIFLPLHQSRVLVYVRISARILPADYCGEVEIRAAALLCAYPQAHP